MINKILSAIGIPFIELYKNISSLGKFLIFQVKLLRLFFKLPIRFKLILKQIEIIGTGSLGVIILTSGFTGMVEAIQLYNGFHKFGAENFMGYTIFISITKELGPVFSALMLISRAISAMTAELGTMRVTEQIDAIDTLAIDSKKYLLVPRIIASTISLPILIIIFDFISNLSAYLISTKALGVNPVAYQNIIKKLLLYSDIYSGIIKGVFFGFAIGCIGTYVGYMTKGGARGVGIATTQAVVISAISIFIINYFLSAFFLYIGW